jgi:SAM-dependent methyltransferase
MGNLERFWGDEFEAWKERKSRSGYGYLVYSERMKKITYRGKILEIGVGDARYLELLSRKNIEIFGIDIIEKACENARESNFPVVLADARRLPFRNNCFDITYSYGVIEHFTETQEAIEEGIRVTKKNGKIIITVPYFYSPYTILSAFWYMLRGKWRMRPASYGKRYTKGKIEKMLSNLPVQVIVIEPLYIGAFFEVLPLRPFKTFFLKLEGKPVFKHLGNMLWVELKKI